MSDDDLITYHRLSDYDLDRLAEERTLVLMQHNDSQQRQDGSYAVTLLLLVCEGPHRGESYWIERYGMFARDVVRDIPKGTAKEVRLHRGSTRTGIPFTGYQPAMSREDKRLADDAVEWVTREW